SNIIEDPKTLVIPKLGVKTSIEHVGMDANGAMDVPKTWANVAWFSPGFQIGSKGSAVLAGHLDTKSGAPAVFYNLNRLQIGDQIKVEGADGKELTFRVINKATYDNSRFPIKEVFGESENP